MRKVAGSRLRQQTLQKSGRAGWSEGICRIETIKGRAYGASRPNLGLVSMSPADLLSCGCWVARIWQQHKQKACLVGVRLHMPIDGLGREVALSAFSTTSLMISATVCNSGVIGEDAPARVWMGTFLCALFGSVTCFSSAHACDDACALGKISFFRILRALSRARLRVRVCILVCVYVCMCVCVFSFACVEGQEGEQVRGGSV